jgi:hypothetical protein
MWRHGAVYRDFRQIAIEPLREQAPLHYGGVWLKRGKLRGRSIFAETMLA